MSYFYIRPMFGGDPSLTSGEAVPFVRPFSCGDRSVDRAVDAALQSVQLPDGFVDRMTALARTLPDEPADQVDYLGC